MAKFTLDEVASGFNLTAINDNFQKIVDQLNDKVLYRDNPVGEPNQMSNSIDLNSNKLLNVANGTNAADGVNLAQVIDIAAGGTGGSGIGDVVDGDLSVLGDITMESALTIQSETVGHPDFVITVGDVVGLPFTTMYHNANAEDQFTAFGAFDASDVNQVVLLDASDRSLQVPGVVRWEFVDKNPLKDYKGSWDNIVGVPTFLLAPENPASITGAGVAIAGTDSSGNFNILSILPNSQLDLGNIHQINISNLLGGASANIVFGNFGGPLFNIDTVQNSSTFSITTHNAAGLAKVGSQGPDGEFTLANIVPTVAAHATSKSYVDAQIAAIPGLTGAVLADGTVPLTATWDLNGFGITTSLAPTTANELANKAYVDSVVGGGITGDLDMLQFDILNIFFTEWENQDTPASFYTAQCGDLTGINTLLFTSSINNSGVAFNTKTAGGAVNSVVLGPDGNVTITGTPTLAAQLATLGSLTSIYYPLTGGNISGNISSSGTIIATGTMGAADPTTAAHIGDRGFNDLRYVQQSDRILAHVATGATFDKEQGFSAVATGGTGVYNLTLDTALANTTDVVINATADAFFLVVGALATTTTNIQVTLVNTATDVAQNSAFSIEVTEI